MIDILSSTLKELRETRGKTQREVAEVLYLPVRTYQNYERGVNAPDIALICAIADYYGVSVDYLVGHDMPTGVDFVQDVVRLTEDERHLIDFYRDATGAGKKMLLDLAHLVSTSSDYGRGT